MDIILNDLSTGYHSRKSTHRVACGLSATLHSGQLTSLLGSNGVGKSTLLKTMTALLPPLHGDIIFGDRNIGDITPKELAQTVSVVLTERPAMQGLTVREVVALGRAPYTGFFGTLSEQDEEIVSAAIEQVAISSLTCRMAHTLSDGERQKVMIAKALAQDTPIIILDEPTAFLDFGTKVDTLLLLRRLAHDTNKAILLSTHDVELALQCSDGLWLMNREGIIVGSPRQLATDGTLSTFFDYEGIAFEPNTMRFQVKR